MVGSLRFPVRLRILEKADVVMKTILRGKRTAEEAPARSFIPDDNVEYTVEWAQCENERAPLPVSEENAKPGTPKLPQASEVNAYECGEAAVYKTDKLVTRKGDIASHALTFVPPPKPECWVSEAEVPKALAIPDAGAPSAPEAAQKEATDAGEDASAPSGDSGAPSADAGATGDAKGADGKDAKGADSKDAKGADGKDAKGADSKDAKGDKGKEPPKK
jgi:hypothetical protein